MSVTVVARSRLAQLVRRGHQGGDGLTLEIDLIMWPATSHIGSLYVLCTLRHLYSPSLCSTSSILTGRSELSPGGGLTMDPSSIESRLITVTWNCTRVALPAIPTLHVYLFFQSTIASVRTKTRTITITSHVIQVDDVNGR